MENSFTCVYAIQKCNPPLFSQLSCISISLARMRTGSSLGNEMAICVGQLTRGHRSKHATFIFGNPWAASRDDITFRAKGYRKYRISHIVLSRSCPNRVGVRKESLGTRLFSNHHDVRNTSQPSKFRKDGFHGGEVNNVF